MKQLKSQIKSKDFSNLYLFTGDEKYLLDVYLNRMVKTIFEGQDQMMNYDEYNADNKDMDKIETSLETLPFFSDRRVVVLKNIGFFDKKEKNKRDRILESLKKIPETTICFMVEDKSDKRNKLYKYFLEKGLVHEFTFLTEKELITFIAKELKKSNMKIATRSAKYFIDTVGYELRSVVTELRKLIDYLGHEEIVTNQDIDQVCTRHLESKIFVLIEKISLKESQEAISLYHDMIALREPQSRILFMISRHFMQLYECKLLMSKKASQDMIAQKVGVPPFVVKKLIEQCRKFDMVSLKKYLKELLMLEYDSRNGKINLETGIELFILTVAKGI